MGAISKAATREVANGSGDFKALLESQWSKISAVAPKHMSRDRLFQLAVSAYNQTPELADCSAVSVLSCVMKCAALGMEPSAVDGLGRAYILPFFNRKTQRKEATFILGYRGMIDLARRSGQIRDISARAVYEGDEFDYSFGLDEHLVHVPADVEHSPQTLTHVYLVVHFKDGGHYIDVMSKGEVERVRMRSKSKDTGPWSTDYEAMACKSVVRRGFKFLPVSVEAMEAEASDETTPAMGDFYEGVPANVDAETGEVVEEVADGQPAEDPE